MDYPTFVIQFPEFRGADVSLIQAQLDAAALELDTVRWGTLFDQAQGYLAAHKLALSPYGQNAKMAAKDGSTTYMVHFKDLVLKQISPGFSST